MVCWKCIKVFYSRYLLFIIDINDRPIQRSDGCWSVARDCSQVVRMSSATHVGRSTQKNKATTARGTWVFTRLTTPKCIFTLIYINLLHIVYNFAIFHYILAIFANLQLFKLAITIMQSFEIGLHLTAKKNTWKWLTLWRWQRWHCLMGCKENWLRNFLTRDLFSDLGPAAVQTNLYAIFLGCSLLLLLLLSFHHSSHLPDWGLILVLIEVGHPRLALGW